MSYFYVQSQIIKTNYMALHLRFGLTKSFEKNIAGDFLKVKILVLISNVLSFDQYL